MKDIIYGPTRNAAVKRRRRPPRHYNPVPRFGLRPPPLSRTAQAMLVIIRACGAAGVLATLDRIQAMLYMADILARQYLGRPITALTWYAE